MINLIAAMTFAMIGYMVWLVAYRLRRDRLSSERAMSRGKRGFRPKERLRWLLRETFGVAEERPDWEAPLLSRLPEVPPPKDVQRQPPEAMLQAVPVEQPRPPQPAPACPTILK
jgi:hypothetical protein